MTVKPDERWLIVRCPRCGESDYRAVGWNRCGLCECEYFIPIDIARRAADDE